MKNWFYFVIFVCMPLGSTMALDFPITEPYTSPLHNIFGSGNDCIYSQSQEHSFEVGVSSEGQWIFPLYGATFDTHMFFGTTLSSNDIISNDDASNTQPEVMLDIPVGTYYRAIEDFLLMCGVAQWINPPLHVEVSCEYAPDSNTILSLAYTNGETDDCLISGELDALPNVVENPDCSKVYTYEWAFTDNYNRTITHTYVVTVEPPVEPQWINPPESVTIRSCDGYDFDAPRPLIFDNGMNGGDCIIQGAVDYFLVVNATDCEGEYVYTWEYTDMCGRTMTHIQTLTVESPAEVQWVNPPLDQTLACNNAPSPFAPINLAYTNGETDDCLISGELDALPNVVENPDCSKVYTYEWAFTDNYNRTITHTYVVTVEPPVEPQWINPPESVTIRSCDGYDFDAPRPLIFDNGMNGGDCIIQGEVDYFLIINATDCEGEYVYTWEYTDMCGRTITHIQTVTIEFMSNVDNIQSNTFKVYPNPTMDLINIEKNISHNVSYQILDVLGKNKETGVLTAGQATLDISTFINGVYFLKMEDQTVKLVKR